MFDGLWVLSWLLVLLPLAASHRNLPWNLPGAKYGDPWNVVDFNADYYYKTITAKMAESLSVSNCTIDGQVGDWPGFNPKKGHAADVRLTIVPPDSDIFTEWRTLHVSLQEFPGHHATRRQFVRVDESLCKQKEFKFYAEGFFRRAKGCLKMVETNPITLRQTKRINAYGATLHPDHARCNHLAGVNACKTSTERATDYPVEVLAETPIANEAHPFIITAKDAVVAKSGMLAFPCGPFGLYASCEAVNWGLPSAREFIADVKACRAAEETSQGGHMAEDPHAGPHALHLDGCRHIVYEKIFVMSQYDDTQIGQFHLEALPRLVYHLDLLYANPEMKIHFGFTKQKTVPKYVLPHNILHWLGLGDRLINGTYYGKEIWMPREGGCQEPGYNMWELYNQRKVFLARAAKEIGSGGRNNSNGWDYPAKIAFTEPDLGPMDYQSHAGDSDKPVVVLVKRGASKFTQNQGDFKIRRWPPQLGGAAAVRDALAEQFPEHSIQIFSDSDFTMMMCQACTVQLFHRADVVVGIHGAGLTNCIYMKPGGVVVEGIPQYDSRHAPITGIFPRLSGMMGLHHYTYDMKNDFSPAKIAKETRRFFDEAHTGQPRIMPLEHSGHADHTLDVHDH